jgi:DNA-binding transcriptional regulator WhiA
MNTHIQIRNVPADLHRKLKIRAAQKDMTLTDYVKKLIEADVTKPTLAELTERIRKLPPLTTTESSAEIIRRERDSR